MGSIYSLFVHNDVCRVPTLCKPVVNKTQSLPFKASRGGSRKETTKHRTTSLQIVKRTIKEVKLEQLPAKATVKSGSET